MTDDLVPLLAERDETAVTRVLGSALEDAPPTARVERAARALGIAPAVALTAGKAAAAGAVTAASKTAASAAVAPHVTHLLWGTLAKWLGVGLLAGSVTSFAVSRLPLARGESDAPLSSPAPLRRQLEPAVTPVADAPPDELVPLPSVAVTSSPSPPLGAPREPAPTVRSSNEPSRAVPSALGAPPLPPPAPTSLERELARLDQARRAVNAHDPARALEALAAYDRELEAPALRAEATLLRVQALVAGGRLPEAQREVANVLSTHPRDGYTCRLTRLAALGDTGCTAPQVSP